MAVLIKVIKFILIGIACVFVMFMVAIGHELDNPGWRDIELEKNACVERKISNGYPSEIATHECGRIYFRR